MREEVQESPERFRRFSGFVGGLRLIFDFLILLLVMLIIGFVVFATGIEHEPTGPVRAADGKAKRVLITGVNRTTTTEELKQLASQGDQYFACCVDIDKEARNTIDNATETSEWVALNRYGSIIVVTSNYHMPRAVAELARVMPGVTLVPYPVVDNNVHLDRWWTYPGTTKLLLSEYLKYLPALGRLGATDFMRMLLTGGRPGPADVPEP